MSTTKPYITVASSEFPPQPGGIGNHAYNLALYLSKSGYEVEVITDQRSNNGLEETDFDSKLPFVVNRIRRRNRRLLMYFNRIQLTMKSFKQADAVIATGKFSLWNVALCRLFYKRHTLAVIHGSEVNRKSFFLRNSIHKALKIFDKRVAVSNYTKSLISHLDIEIEVIPNGINIADWSGFSMTSDKKLKGIPCMTTVGRVSERKGQLQVIRHLPELIKQFPEIHYHCIGISQEADAFIKIAKELGVDNHVTFHGAVDNSSLKQILKQTDVFVMLSTTSNTGDVEGFGIAILEANALGIPAIGGSGSGIEDAISDYNSGILIEGSHVVEFQKALHHILEHKSKYNTEAKKWAEAHDWNVIIKRYISQLA